MDLRLKFIGVNESDVIATSTKCSIEDAYGSFKYVDASSYPSNPNYYVFIDTLGTYNYQSPLYMGYNLSNDIIDVNGKNKGPIAPTVGKYYHYDDNDHVLYECNNPDHYGTFGG